MVHGLPPCAHCGALLTGPICAICGKSERDEVEVVETEERATGLGADGRRQLLGVGGFVVAAAILGGVGFAYFTREPAEPTPQALATPTPTSSTTTVPVPTVQPPTIQRPEAVTEPPPTIEIGAERSVQTSDGANPWNGAPARNVLTGAPLDNTDYRPGIETVAAVVGRLTTDFVVAPPTRTEMNGVDLAAAEPSQPFAARSVAGETGVIADVWVIARGPATDDGSAAFFDQAVAAWPIDDTMVTFSPRPGVRLVQLSDDGTETLWLDLRSRWLALYRAPSGTDAALLGAISDGWN